MRETTEQRRRQGLKGAAVQARNTAQAAERALAFIRENPGVVICQMEACIPLTEGYATRAVHRLRREGKIAWSKELSGWVATDSVGADGVRPGEGGK